MKSDIVPEMERLEFDNMIRRIFKTRNKIDGVFKDIEHLGFNVHLEVVPFSEVVKLAKSSCNKCNSKGYRIDNIDILKYNITWCIYMHKNGKEELITPELYRGMKSMVGKPVMDKDENGKEINTGKVHSKFVRIKVACICVDKKMQKEEKGYLHNNHRTEWYNLVMKKLETPPKEEETEDKNE